MSTIPIYALVDTWDNVGTTFKGISLDVTDTASASGSLLMDLQVGGVSKFSVRKGGAIINGGGPNGGAFFGLSASLGVEYIGNSLLLLGASGITAAMDRSNRRGISTTHTGAFAFGSGVNDANVVNADLTLFRDAAGTLAQRDGVNAQALRVYNTFTDASNYERGVFDFTSVANQLTIGTEKAGTGATRIVRVVVGGTRVAISDGSYFQIDKDLYALGNVITAAKYTQMSEMTAPAAPAANGVRIYAEDDGAGKTRLMALFATGVAQQIAIEP